MPLLRAASAANSLVQVVCKTSHCHKTMPPKKRTTKKSKGTKQDQKGAPPARPNAIPWDEHHPARILLYEAIQKDEISPEMKPKAVYMKYSHTAAFNSWGMEYNANFGVRLNGLRSIVKELKDRKEVDAEDFKTYRELHPRPATDRKGIPFWDGSQAQVLLNIDMDNNLHMELYPEELWKTKELYQQWDKDIFRGHIHQEKDTRKYLHTLHAKAEELAALKKEQREALEVKVTKYSDYHFEDSEEEGSGTE